MERWSGLILAAGAFCLGAPAVAAPVFAIQTTPALAKIPVSFEAAAAITPRDAWVVGGRLTAHWDGTTWTQVSTPGESATLLDIAAAATNDVWSVGNIASNNPPTVTFAQMWNGRKWAKVATPPVQNAQPYFNTVTVLAANDVWAAGSINFPDNDQLLPLFEHWDGRQWTVTTLSLGDTFVNKLSAISTNDIWAVGYTVGQANTPFAAHWDGTSWSQVTVPKAGIGSTLLSVAAVATNNVWAVGNATLNPIFTNKLKTVSYNPVQTLIEHWDGAHWSVVPSPNVGPLGVYQANHLYAITALSATDLWAAGSFTLPDGSNRQLSLALHGNGTSWTLAPVPNVGLNNLLHGAASAAPSTVWFAGSGRFPNLISGSGPLIVSAPGG
jgi:hypothetical protein